ncbi:MAG TPA: SDR family oxidoreductase [Candidatus Cloacimonetes bacterium]|nr:SDR family oxidoreductase [Candidatus Cloacimonadota bacterium]HEX37705.1 SDR family oxidoreductase [Candidatus Cloacimonadota bacterium]
MDLGIKDKIAFITAASKGLGKAVAMQLAREEVQVIICARNEDDLIKAKADIEYHSGSEIMTLKVDVTKSEQVHNAVITILKEFGGIDILVCNAGGPPAGMFEDFTPDDYREAVELNLMSTINLCYEVIPYMKKNTWGRIINITSVSVKQPIDNLILSNTSRTGVIGFTKSLSNQVAKYGITVNAVCPSYTKTQRVENLAHAFEESGKGSMTDFYKNIENTIPMRRIGTPEEFASAVAYLASQQADYITGVALQIDGGFVKGLF